MFNIGDYVEVKYPTSYMSWNTYRGTVWYRETIGQSTNYLVSKGGLPYGSDGFVNEKHISLVKLREESETMVYDVGGTVIEFKDLMDGDTAAFRMASGAWYVAKVEYAAEAHRGFVNVQGKITVDKVAYGEVRLLHRSFSEKDLSVREAIENVLGTGTVSDVALTKLVNSLKVLDNGS